jgi:hypothetical protein
LDGAGTGSCAQTAAAAQRRASEKIIDRHILLNEYSFDIGLLLYVKAKESTVIVWLKDSYSVASDQWPVQQQKLN